MYRIITTDPSPAYTTSRTLMYSSPELYFPGTNIIAGAEPYENSRTTWLTTGTSIANAFEQSTSLLWSSGNQYAKVSKKNSKGYTEKIHDISIYPNLFNPNTTIQFSLKENVSIVGSIIDILGKGVKTFYSGSLEKGVHQISINAYDLPTGHYWIRLTAPNFQITKPISILK